jgi:hypothetical protein
VGAARRTDLDRICSSSCMRACESRATCLDELIRTGFAHPLRIRRMLSASSVMAVPFPAQGHQNQLLHLSLQLAASGLPAARALRGAGGARPPGPRACARLGRRRSPPHPVPRPRHLRVRLAAARPRAAPPSPSHLMPLWKAFTASAPAPVAALLGDVSASHRRVVVLYDPLNGFVAEEAARGYPSARRTPFTAPPCCSSSGGWKMGKHSCGGPDKTDLGCDVVMGDLSTDGRWCCIVLWVLPRRGRGHWPVPWDLLNDRLLQLCLVAAPFGFAPPASPPLPRLVRRSATCAPLVPDQRSKIWGGEREDELAWDPRVGKGTS